MLLLPLAHLKVMVFDLPLYSVEIPILVASIAYVYGWKRRMFSPLDTLDFRNPFVIGTALFLLGALLSFAANPFSLSGLGMLKTWFVFPLLALWLWLETKPDSYALNRMLLVWLSTIVLSALASLTFFFQGTLTYDGRLEAWYASPNHLAFFLAPGILLTSYFFLRLPSLKRNYFRIVSSVAFAVLIFALFLTRSYEVWISIAVTLPFFLALAGADLFSWRKKIALALFLVSVFSAFVFFESGSEKWQSFVTLSPRSSLASRVMIWESSVRIISDHPLLGIGIGRFQETYLAYQKYFPPYLEWAVPQPHNLYIALWLETGLTGLLGFSFLIITWLRKMRAFSRSLVSGEAKKTGALLLSLLVFFLVLGFADTPFFKTDLAFIFWLILAFGIGFLKEQKDTQL